MVDLTDEEIRQEARAVFLLTIKRVKELVKDGAPPLKGSCLQAVLRFCSDNRLSLLNSELVRPAPRTEPQPPSGFQYPFEDEETRVPLPLEEE